MVHSLYFVLYVTHRSVMRKRASYCKPSYSEVDFFIVSLNPACNRSYSFYALEKVLVKLQRFSCGPQCQCCGFIFDGRNTE